MLNYAKLACHVVPKILHSSNSTLFFNIQPDTQLLLVRLLGLSADEIWWNDEMLLGFCKSPSDTEDVKGGTQKDTLFITLPCNLQSQCITNFCKTVCRSMNLNPAETWKKDLCFADAIVWWIMWLTCFAHLCEHCNVKWICHLSCCKALDISQVDITASWPCVSLIEHVKVCNTSSWNYLSLPVSGWAPDWQGSGLLETLRMTYCNITTEWS